MEIDYSAYIEIQTFKLVFSRVLPWITIRFSGIGALVIRQNGSPDVGVYGCIFRAGDISKRNRLTPPAELSLGEVNIHLIVRLSVAPLE